MQGHNNLHARLSKTIARLERSIRQGKIALAQNYAEQLTPLLDLNDAVSAAIDKPSLDLVQIDALSSEQIRLKHGLSKPELERITSDVLTTPVNRGLTNWRIGSPEFDVLVWLTADKLPQTHVLDEFHGAFTGELYEEGDQ